MAKKNKKKRYHIPYNKKAFVAPDSINSMSAVHTKILTDGTAVIRISDCHGSIRWHNNMNKKDEVKEMLTKLDIIQNMISEFKKEVELKLNN